MASFVSDLFNGNVNLAIGSLPLTLFLAALPHWYTIYTAEKNKVQGGWSNENPRAFVARLNAKAASGKKLSDVEELILRGQSAQQNGFEWWAVWAVAVVSLHFSWFHISSTQVTDSADKMNSSCLDKLPKSQPRK